nr:GLUG motif-containing protein [Parabacteroides goldsteinii]
MKKHLHLISYRLLITIAFLCFFSKGMRADDTTPDTWENHITVPADWNTSPYPTTISISSAEELAWVAKMVNEDTQTGDSPSKTTGFEGVTINLTTDLDLSGYLWISIGKDNLNDEKIKQFKGTFDGGNHTISNMTISTQWAAGLFGHIKDATIKNVTLTGCSIKKTKRPVVRDQRNIFTGCIAAQNTNSTIQSCHAKGDIERINSEGECIGGITGRSTDSTVSDCTFEGSITAHQSEYGLKNKIGSGWIGGIVGDHGKGDITNCHAILTMITGGADVGGITSINRGHIKDCTTKGKIELTSERYLYGLGGIAGQNSSSVQSGYSIEKCNSSCDINLIYTANDSDPSDWNRAIAGGIVGDHSQNSAPVIGCTSSGTITVQLITSLSDETILKKYKSYVGGIAGKSNSEIKDCQSSTNISATSTPPSTTIYIGGIAGYTTIKPITNCTASGNILSDGSVIYSGGITGYNNSALANCQSNIPVIADENQSGYSVITNGISAKGRTCYIGGISGINYKTIKNCYSTSHITTESSSKNYAGGLVGYNYGKNTSNGEIKDCYATGNVSSTGVDNRVGGIVGHNEFHILNCYTTSRVEAIKTDQNAGYVGGIAGTNPAGNIENCLALNISGITNYATSTGRIIGYNYNGGSSTNNYAHTEIPENSTPNIPYENGDDWDNTSYPFNPSDAWDFTDATQLPKLKKLNDGGSYSETVSNQPDIPLINLQFFTITFDTPVNGTLTVNQADGSPLSSGDKVLGGTKLTITAEAAESYLLEKLQVNDLPFTSGEVLTVSAHTTITVTFTKKPDPIPDPEPEPEPTPTPPVYHLVTLPQIEGATTDPVAGEYEVEAWSSFRFYLTLDKEYDQSSPIVTTDRGETITPRASDGAYIIKYVRQPIAISIDGIVRNPDPVANETIGTNETKVRTEDAYLHIHTSHPETVFIYTFSGTLLHKYDNLSGDKSLWLPQGNYIVVAGNKSFKIQIQK